MRKALRKTGILAFILAVYFSLSVAAAQMVSLEASTDGVAVQLSGVTENVSTMKISFEIKTQQGICSQAAFDFDGSIASEVQEYRYDEETGILTLYLSGTEKLFQDGSLILGKITLQAEKSTKVQVSVVTDSFAYVGEDAQEVSAALPKASAVWSNETKETEETATPTKEEVTTKKAEDTTKHSESTKPVETTVSKTDSDTKTDLQKDTTAEQKVTDKTKAAITKGKSEKVTDRTGTGDSKNITGYVIGIVAAALILVIGFCWKKKRK